jgi:hypothetical protein
MKFEQIRAEVDDRVLTITLNRPESARRSPIAGRTAPMLECGEGDQAREF